MGEIFFDLLIACKSVCLRRCDIETINTRHHFEQFFTLLFKKLLFFRLKNSFLEEKYVDVS